MLHIGKHAAQRHLDIVKELCHIKLFELGSRCFTQPPNPLCALKLRGTVAHRHPAETVIIRRGVKKIAGYLGVVHEAVKRQRLGYELCHEVFDTVGYFLGFIRENEP